MLSLIRNIFSHVWARNEYVEDVADDEEFLAQQLLQLEIDNVDDDSYNDEDNKPPPQSECFERTGTVTYLSDDYGLIDGTLYFDRDSTVLPLNINEKVRYLAYKNSDEDTPKILRILQSLGPLWDEEEAAGDQKEFKTREHLLVGQVDYRDKRLVVLRENAMKFSLDDVQSSFIPVQGDWLELSCKVQWDDDSPCDVQKKQILDVISVRPLRIKVFAGKVTSWNGVNGICDRQIYINKQSCQFGFELFVGARVVVEAIESDQCTCIWRAVNIVPDGEMKEINNEKVLSEVDEEKSSYSLENEKNLFVTKDIEFSNVDYNEKKSSLLEVQNNSTRVYTLLKWKLMSSRQDSQLIIEPFITRRLQIHPNKTFKFTLTCDPKVLGKSRETFVLVFDGFQIKRNITFNVVDTQTKIDFNLTETSNIKFQNCNNQFSAMKNINLKKRNGLSVVSGVRPIKPPAFVPVKLGSFTIPDRVWAAVLGDSNQTIYSPEISDILKRMVCAIPCLAATLNISNYTDRFHALLYIDEIQQNVQMRTYDMPKAFLTPSQNYLSLEVQGLSEKRPSLIRGDSVMATEIWNTDSPVYEGYIHEIRGDVIYLKFNPQFHDRYTGYDISLEFQFSRSVYRRCHQAINLAITHLGPDILFPSRIIKREPQVSQEKLQNMSWYNKNLNQGQQKAVRNIIKGGCRPMPYCIFGPPGTGKTITVVETILQILNLLPDSRILIATPSNSAANLLTERLLKYENSISGSLVRLIAHYLIDSDTLPDAIKPYCATLDIASENTAKCNYSRNVEGVNLGCRTSFIGRHRVTIGTCSCLGTLAMMGLPRGHFTHVIVDEAGQATEPEIMIPMTFIDKDNGQIVLAGDPLQLGPVVISKYSQEFGLDQSYLERLLDRFPYQKDKESFKDQGYDERLITQLTFNYRSLSEVIILPSEMFYSGTLVPQLTGKENWVVELLKDIGELLPRRNGGSAGGGVYLYGVKGVNLRAADSPSWYNPQEATMLLLYTCKLLKKNVVPDQIGIITPYIAQIKYLRKLFETTGTPQPKIGTVEEFQGQERCIILLSTVRSSESLLEEDYKFALGFVKSPKRLNVAITRAQVAVVLFCDPHLLSKDALWGKVIAHSVAKGQYTGCDMPASYEPFESEPM